MVNPAIDWREGWKNRIERGIWPTRSSVVHLRSGSICQPGNTSPAELSATPWPGFLTRRSRCCGTSCLRRRSRRRRYPGNQFGWVCGHRVRRRRVAGRVWLREVRRPRPDGGTRRRSRSSLRGIERTLIRLAASFSTAHGAFCWPVVSLFAVGRFSPIMLGRLWRFLNRSTKPRRRPKMDEELGTVGARTLRGRLSHPARPTRLWNHQPTGISLARIA